MHASSVEVVADSGTFIYGANVGLIAQHKWLAICASLKRLAAVTNYHQNSSSTIRKNWAILPSSGY